VTVAEQPSEFGVAGEPARQGPKTEKQADELDKLGVEVTDLTPEMAKQLGYKEGTKGVVVTKVQPNSPAADAGLHRGMLLVKVDKKWVKDVNAVHAAVSHAALDKGVLLQVQSPEVGMDYVLVKVPTATADKK